MIKGKKIAVLGSCGQIGTELTLELRKRYGNDMVVCVGRKTEPCEELKKSGVFVNCDITDKEQLKKLLIEHKIDILINMAAILSASGEKNPKLCWKVNIDGLVNCLDLGVELKLTQILVPSSIAVFGPTTPKVAPNDTVLGPSTMYGITKVTGEMLGNYYFEKYGLDIRGLRYPGIISNKILPGGGTTDYAVEIYYAALKYKKYECFLRKDTKLPMMYMPDCIKSTIDLMEADSKILSRRCDYNVGAISFTPEEITKSIQKYIPEFKITYKVDWRQEIADSWPGEVVDTVARKDWGWKHSFDLDKMTKDMLNELKTNGNLKNYVNSDLE